MPKLSIATVEAVVKVGKRAYKYIKDDSKSRYMLTEEHTAELICDGPVPRAILTKGRAFRGRWGSLDKYSETPPGNKSLFLAIQPGYKWNGADLVPHKDQEEPENGAWASEFLASLEHDFILEFRHAIALSLDVRVSEVEDFAHALFKLREKQSGQKFRGAAAAHGMKILYPWYARIKKLLRLSCFAAAASLLFAGCSGGCIEHQFDDATPPMNPISHVYTNTTWGANAPE
jgi:hypothetical protein